MNQIVEKLEILIFQEPKHFIGDNIIRVHNSVCRETYLHKIGSALLLKVKTNNSDMNERFSHGGQNINDYDG